jgi:hypothetical protein
MTTDQLDEEFSELESVVRLFKIESEIAFNAESFSKMMQHVTDFLKHVMNSDEPEDISTTRLRMVSEILKI